MGILKVTRGFVLAGVAAVMIAASTAQAQNVTIGPIVAVGLPGTDVDFEIVYDGPINANGLSFNILYPPSAAAVYRPVLKTGSTTKVRCSTAPDLDPNISTSAVLFNGGSEIGFTVIGANTDGVFPFGRTGTLGSCKFTLAETAFATLPLTCDATATGKATASDVNGNDLPASCVDGILNVSGVELTIGPLTPSGAPGDEVDFNITYTGPANANGISLNILYPASAAAVYSPVFETGSTTKVVCSTAPDLDPNISTSAVVFNGGTEIGFTVIGANTSGVFPFGIAQGMLGSCKFKIAATASGTVPLPCDNTATGKATASDVNGDELAARCVDGVLTITTPVAPTATPTPTSTTAPSVTPTPVPPTMKATATATNAGTPVIPGGAVQEDEGGCQIGTGGRSSSGWLVLIPTLGLLVMRRRRR